MWKMKLKDKTRKGRRDLIKAALVSTAGLSICQKKAEAITSPVTTNRLRPPGAVSESILADILQWSCETVLSSVPQ